LSLPSPQPRTHLHTRNVVFRGFRLEDGLWDIDAELRDTKPDIFELPGVGVWQPDEPMHDMTMRVTIDDALVVREIAVAMDSVPHRECPLAQSPMQAMIGCTMGPGWRQAIDRNLGASRGCTHLRELLFNMATVAYQTMPEVPPSEINERPPHHLGKCIAWDFNGAAVKQYHPGFLGWQPKTVVKDSKVL
jgi:hypothetical protein